MKITQSIIVQSHQPRATITEKEVCQGSESNCAVWKALMIKKKKSQKLVNNLYNPEFLNNFFMNLIPIIPIPAAVFNYYSFSLNKIDVLWILETIKLIQRCFFSVIHFF